MPDQSKIKPGEKIKNKCRLKLVKVNSLWPIKMNGFQCYFVQSFDVPRKISRLRHSCYLKEHCHEKKSAKTHIQQQKHTNSGPVLVKITMPV